MKKIVFIVLFFTLLGHTNGQNTNNGELDCISYLNHLDSLENSVLFDIRLFNLYEESRIDHALWAGTKDSFEVYLKEYSKDTPIFIYCQIGKRTKQCLSWLKSLGFSKVYLLKGGFENWVKNGYPIDSTKVN